MKKLIFSMLFAASFVGTTAMAQQPEQKNHACQHRHDHAVKSCQHSNDPNAKACPHQGQPAGQHQCSHGEKQGQHQCSHGEKQGRHQCSHGEKQGQHQCGHGNSYGQRQCSVGGDSHGQHQCSRSQNAFRPKGKAVITLFNHLGATNTNEGWTQNGFQMERAYLGYRYQFAPHWTATVVVDAAQAAGGDIERVFVKNANVQYKNNGLTAVAGIINTSHASLAEQYWGLRYVARSMYDLYGYGHTADLGFRVQYDFAPWLSADVSMLNGEGYRRMQLDNHYLYGLGINISPFENFDIRVYGDIQTHDTNQVSVPRGFRADTVVNNVARKNLHLFAGYDHRYFRLGAEYNMQFASDYVRGNNATGLSVYAIGKISRKLSLFGRYDRGVSGRNNRLGIDFDYERNGQDIFAGVDYRINKVVSVSPAMQYHIAPGNAASLYAYLSCKVSL